MLNNIFKIIICANEMFSFVYVQVSFYDLLF